MIRFTFPFLFLVSVATSALADLDSLKRDVVSNYANLVHANYADALVEAVNLQGALTAFANEPDEAGLAKARMAWISARLPYLQTEVFRFYAGPIDDDDGPEGLINAWPLDEAYVDYVEGNPSVGIVNDTANFPEITKELLVSVNEKDGEENISAGFHAIEFLLWGQDENADGPGNRSADDYITAPNADRRKAYLLAAGELLVENLEHLVAEWAPGQDNYRKSFEAAPSSESLKKIITGMSMLAGFELSGERLLVAMETRAQEDEHSCFSDTTHSDVIYNAKGIANVWEGEYGNVKGAGIDDLAKAVDADLRKKLRKTIQEALKLSKQIPVPFDQAILEENGRASILAVVETLEDQADLLVELSQKLGFEVPTSETDS
tara:strand:- start:397 stop:1530 length:1134 start_codon:yes stop_codon:yes gene_type:complete